jgi:hypothetical protein
MDDRLAMAISRWAPRFTTSGVTTGSVTPARLGTIRMQTIVIISAE